MNILGLDIGGANTKATYIKTIDGALKEQRTALEYFPIWKDGKDKLPKVLEKLKTKLANSVALDAVGVTITAELSDAYMT
ncbi:MAG: H4MPT-linked C1 transfer pathway protein, partial [Candidatus Bathyarchaeota archaeon]